MTRGGQNLCSLVPRERAQSRTYKKDVFKRVIKGDVFGNTLVGTILTKTCPHWCHIIKENILNPSIDGIALHKIFLLFIFKIIIITIKANAKMTAQPS